MWDPQHLTSLQVLTACCGVRLTFLCDDDVREEWCASVLVTASVVPNLRILVTLMMEALTSSETSVLTRATRRSISEDTILHSHHRKNLKSYMMFRPHRSNPVGLHSLLRGWLYFFICGFSSYLTGNTYVPPRPVKGTVLL
jgi:hypothetical protein